MTSKTAFITGATSGIGAATAKRFAKEGIRLILCGRRQELLDALHQKLATVRVDMSPAELHEVAKAARDLGSGEPALKFEVRMASQNHDGRQVRQRLQQKHAAVLEEMCSHHGTPGATREAKTLPMIDIKPPAPEEFEVRLVIWETKDVPMKTKDGETKLDMKVNVNFIGYEFIQSEGGTGQMNNRWDYAQSYGEIYGRYRGDIGEI